MSVCVDALDELAERQAEIEFVAKTTHCIILYCFTIFFIFHFFSPDLTFSCPVSVETISDLLECFEAISSSVLDDGAIDMNEFAKVLHCSLPVLALTFQRHQQALGLSPQSLLMTRFFQRFNVTRSRRMNFREFAMALSVCSSNASREERTKCATVFHNGDFHYIRN